MEQYQEPKSNNSLIKAGLFLAVALAGIFSYLYFNLRTESSQQLQAKETIITENTRELMITNTKLDSISNQLDLKIAEIESLGGTVEELQAAKNQLIADKKTLLGSKKIDLAKYDAKIRDLESLLASKDTEIARLREENQALTGQNQVLTGQNQNLNRENTGLKTEVNGLQKDKATLSDSVYNVTVQNRELSEKVTVAAALRVVNLQVNALNSRGKERDGGEYKARRVDKVKVGFKLADNPLTRRDEKEIFLRLVDPNGNVISDMATGSGVFSFAGKETVYSAKQKVMYTNNGQNVEFIYDRGSNYEKGTYNIELYSESFRIGTGSFTIK